MNRKIFFVSLTALLVAGISVPLVGQNITAENKAPQKNQDEHKKFPSQRRFRGNHLHGFFSRLTPDERAKISQLIQSKDKQALKKYMAQLFYKYQPAEVKKVHELSQKYLAETDAAKRAEIKKELEKAVRIEFEKRQEFTRNNIKKTEEQLAKVQRDLERLKKIYLHGNENSEKIIASRVEQMCLPKEKRIRQQPRRKSVSQNQTQTQQPAKK